MMCIKPILCMAVFTLLFGSTAYAQKPLNLEEIVAGKVIETKRAGSVTWLKDGTRYSSFERNAETGGTDIVAYRAKDNAREVLIPSTALVDKTTGKPLAIRSIAWSADNEKLLIYNNTHKVWRYDTRGDYWVLDRQTGALRQLGKGMPEASLMFAKFLAGWLTGGLWQSEQHLCGRGGNWKNLAVDNRWQRAFREWYLRLGL